MDASSKSAILLENLHDLITACLSKIAFLYLASLLSSNAHVQDMTYCILLQKGDRNLPTAVREQLGMPCCEQMLPIFDFLHAAQ